MHEFLLNDKFYRKFSKWPPSAKTRYPSLCICIWSMLQLGLDVSMHHITGSWESNVRPK